MYTEDILVCSTCKEEKHYNLFAKKGKQKPHECKSCRNVRERSKRSENPDGWNEKIRKRYEINKENINSTRRKNLQKRRDNDPKYRAAMSLRCRLYLAVKEKKGKTMELTGCSVDELLKYLESKFTEGMSWENYGKWHIDHIKPCSSFKLEDLEEQKKCFHWTNLQPLWAIDNLKKGSIWIK
jgi:hypothetical protein